MFRVPGANRPIDYPPNQRLSWLVDLLPYLGDGEYKDLPHDPEKSWNEGENLLLAQVVVPQLLGPLKPDSTLQIRYPGVPEPLAPTHFVGVAGLGFDAADYSPNDPNAAKKLGIFGYDRVTKIEEVKDGLENTIAL